MVAAPKIVDDEVYEHIYAVPGGAPGYDRNMQLARGAKQSPQPLAYLRSRNEAFWAVSEQLRGLGSKSVLEIGCGLGHFTYALHKAGYDVRGVDLSAGAVAAASASFGDLYTQATAESLVAEHSGAYDAIVMIEVIEHLVDPVSVLSDALPLLKPGGSIIVTTPNRSYFGYEADWTTDLPPVHLWWLSEDSLRTIGGRLDCNVSFQDFTSYSARYPQLLSYVGPQEHMLDESGRLVRRENAIVALARKTGVLHEAYWLASAAAGKVGAGRAPASSRGTLVAALSPRSS